MKVLLVDDEVDILMSVGKRLQMAGYEVVKAENGFDALEAVRDSVPDLIVTDVAMPDMTGYELCRAVKENSICDAIPVIMLTAKSQDTDKFWGEEMGADAYITKPFDHEELLAEIARLLDKKK